MLEKSAIENGIKEVLATQFEFLELQLKGDTNFIVNLGMDSLDVVRLISATEKAFKVEIPNSEIAKIQTIDELVNYIHSKKV